MELATVEPLLEDGLTVFRVDHCPHCHNEEFIVSDWDIDPRGYIITCTSCTKEFFARELEDESFISFVL